MKKNNSLGYIILGILFVLLTVIAFAIPTVKTGTFWIAYVSTAVAFALQIPIWKKALGQEETLKSKFLGIPTVHVSIVYLVLQVIAFAVFMAVSTLPSWAAIVVCAINLGLSAVCMISAEIGVGEINRVEEKVKAKTFFIKSLQTDVDLLAEAEPDCETKALLKQLAEKIRYSDPMSHVELAEIEAAILSKAAELKKASDKTAIITEILSLVTERNEKCKILKEWGK